MGLSEVSSILWRERQLLELLLFKLEEQQLLLAAGRTRWLPHATNEVDRVLAQIRNGEIATAMEVEAAALDLHLPANPSLNQLVDAAPAPWKAILSDHHEAFTALSREIAVLAEANHDLLNRGRCAGRLPRRLLGWSAQVARRHLRAPQERPIGARFNQGQSMQTRAEHAMTMMRGGLSQVEDIDLPRTVMDLQMQQVAYQAALSVTAKVIRHSLADFLR